MFSIRLPRSGKSSAIFVSLYRCTHLYTKDVDFLMYVAADTTFSVPLDIRKHSFEARRVRETLTSSHSIKEKSVLYRLTQGSRLLPTACYIDHALVRKTVVTRSHLYRLHNSKAMSWLVLQLKFTFCIYSYVNLYAKRAKLLEVKHISISYTV